MEVQNTADEVGCTYKKRVKRGRRRKELDFERMPAIKIPGPNGSVLLQPLQAKPPVSHPAFITIRLAEGVTAQLVAEPSGRPQ